MLWFSYCCLSLSILEQLLNSGLLPCQVVLVRAVQPVSIKQVSGLLLRCASFPVSMADCLLWRRWEAGDSSEIQTWGTSRTACL